MYSLDRVLTIPPSPPCSTPFLESDAVEYAYLSPLDDYLITPDISDWREIRMLEYEKDGRLAADVGSFRQLWAFDCDRFSFQNFDLPVLELWEQEPVVSGSPPDSPAWPYATIAPEDVFPDYAEVRQYLAEQARPPSPILEYELVEIEIPFCEDVGFPAPSMAPASPVRGIGTKSKRDEDDEQPAPKRHRFHHVSTEHLVLDMESDDDRDQADNDSGYFQPSSRRPVKCQRSMHRRSKTNRRPPAPKPAKCNRGEQYEKGTCSCRVKNCSSCKMTCFYPFVHGERKGEVCRRLFGKNRHLDLKRHMASHAIHEWKLLEDGEITREDAYWHLVVFEGKEHGLICPNEDCPTTFTRYDALKRHMEQGTCHHENSIHDEGDLNNRQLKAKVIKASNEKFARTTQARHLA